MPADITNSIYYEILEHEVRLARSVATTTRTVRPFSVWEVMIPIVFILGYMRGRQQRELFVQNFIFTKKLALQTARDIKQKSTPFEQAFERVKIKTQHLLEKVDKKVYSESIRQAQLAEMRLLITHYQRMFDTHGRRYAECITRAYPERADYLAFVRQLEKAEKDVTEAAILTVGESANRDMVERIESSTHKLRLKDADLVYATTS